MKNEKGKQEKNEMNPTPNEKSLPAKMSSPYLTEKIYKIYEKAMTEKNLKRKKSKLSPLRIKNYKDWSS